MGGKTHPIDKWRAGDRKGVRLADLEKEVARLDLGLSIDRTPKGEYKAKHPRLGEDPRFPRGYVLFSAHAFGNQGEVHPSGIADLVKAITFLQNL